jgi:hypothetical protein
LIAALLLTPAPRTLCNDEDRAPSPF